MTYMIKTPHILSIQSHVVTGYVGNRAAVFPLQSLGIEVSVVNTVQFSNHTGYGKWTGDVFSPEHIQSLMEGLSLNKTFEKIDAILSGYQGSSALGEIILKTVQELKKNNPHLIYCCDPVIGDVDRGVYVKPEVALFIKNNIVPYADILTPNQFELAYLTGTSIQSLDEAQLACKILHQKGVKTILVTSLIQEEIKNKNLISLLLSTDKEQWLISTPYLPFKSSPTGSGDVTAALFLGYFLKWGDFKKALEYTTSTIYTILKNTLDLNSGELALIYSRDSFYKPELLFNASLLK